VSQQLLLPEVMEIALHILARRIKMKISNQYVDG
jgi:hypothetical protein